MLAQAEHHLIELMAASAAASDLGIPTAIIAPVAPNVAVAPLRPAWRRLRTLLDVAAASGLAPTRRWTDEDVARSALALVVQNDWGPRQALVQRCNDAHLPTFGWVEGVQDFDDEDTGRRRLPYRTVQTVLALGEYDTARLVGARTVTVGSERLWRLWREPCSTREDDVVANVNFTYGVLEHARAGWVRGVVAACDAANRSVLISRHPADSGLVGRRRQTTRSSNELLGTCSTLVSRFSTLCYEALVRGVPLVYHNPHGERVPTFQEPNGAFTTTCSVSDLADALRRTPPDGARVRTDAGPFLRRHLVLDGPSPAETVATVIERAL